MYTFVYLSAPYTHVGTLNVYNSILNVYYCIRKFTKVYWNNASSASYYELSDLLMSLKETISLRIGEPEKQFLEAIAHAFNLHKRQENAIPYAKALQLVLTHCIAHQITPINNKGNKLDEMHKMIEQIHAAIPHLLYQNNLQSMILSSQYKDEELKPLKHKNIHYLNEHFAGFQNVSYSKVSIKINGIGLKTLPLEEGVSLWS